MCVVTFPSVSKLESSAPSVVSRATAKSVRGIPPWSEEPATSTRPALSTATPLALSLVLPKSIVCLPSPSKLKSGAPEVVSRATAKSPAE